MDAPPPSPKLTPGPGHGSGRESPQQRCGWAARGGDLLIVAASGRVLLTLFKGTRLRRLWRFSFDCTRRTWWPVSSRRTWNCAPPNSNLVRFRSLRRSSGFTDLSTTIVVSLPKTKRVLVLSLIGCGSSSPPLEPPGSIRIVFFVGLRSFRRTRGLGTTEPSPPTNPQRVPDKPKSMHLVGRVMVLRNWFQFGFTSPTSEGSPFPIGAGLGLTLHPSCGSVLEGVPQRPWVCTRSPGQVRRKPPASSLLCKTSLHG